MKPATPHDKSAGKQYSAQLDTARQFPIVAIGASAGGLVALEEFLAAIPVDSGVAYIIISHLVPDHISLLPDLLARKSVIPVRQAADNLKVLPEQVYIIPPARK